MTGVAIVIPMLNEAARLPRLLRSLAALEPPPAEVLAVDGGSADASVAIAEAAGLLVVPHDTRGRAAAITGEGRPSFATRKSGGKGFQLATGRTQPFSG